MSSDMDEAMARLEVIAFMQGFERDRRRAMDLVGQWRNNERAEAWDEGFDAGERDAFHLDTHPDHTCTPNPYRQKEQDQ